MAFDLVSSEYGWPDERILDLPLARFHQITAAISHRKYLAAREENSRFSWLARNLAGFVAAGYMTDGKSENKAIDMASKLAFDDIEKAALGDERERPAPSAQKENGNGSYERLMKAFGNDLRAG